MRGLGFTSINKVVCHNRFYTVSDPVNLGSYLGVTDYRASADALRQHTYKGVYYGIWYGNLSTIANYGFMLSYASESFLNDVRCIGVRARPAAVGVSMTLDIVDGTFDPSGHPSPLRGIYATTPFNIPTLNCMVAWYFETKTQAGQPNTSSFWLNKVEIPMDNKPNPGDPDIETFMPSNVIMPALTPVGSRLGMLWAGFEETVTKAQFQSILDNWTGATPYLLGRYGEWPLGGIPSKTYINCSEPVIYDRAFEAYYAPAGTVDYVYNYNTFTVPDISTIYGFDE